MHNRLIFRYHRLRAQRRTMVAKGMVGPSGPTGTDPPWGASEAGTQEGK